MSNSEMTLWDHLDDLRKTIIRCIVVLLLFGAAFFIAMPVLFDQIILAPCKGDFILYRGISALSESIGQIGGKQINFMPEFQSGHSDLELINIRLASQFFVHLSTSCWLGVLFAFPFFIYFLWKFISPALYPQEQRYVKQAFLLGNTLFYIGIAVGYLVVFPLTLRFLSEYRLSTLIENQISLDSYMNNFISMIFVMGIVFEMPLLCWLLSKIGLLKRSFFQKYRRHAIVVLLTLAAFITPSADPFTLLSVFLPLYLLFEFSALIVKKQ